MTLVSLTDCCHLLAIDPKTLRRWLSLAHIAAQPHPLDARDPRVSRVNKSSKWRLPIAVLLQIRQGCLSNQHPLPSHHPV
jgi:hypothetical protein